MYSFASDYLEGAHPRVLEALVQSNAVQTLGYSLDEYTQRAIEVMKKEIGREDVDIHLLVGGTQTNLIMISSILKPYQAAIACDTGHINTHETGSIEATGHKVVTCPHRDGKVTIDGLQMILDQHSDEHWVMPKLVYLSQTTELGTTYTKAELTQISQFCKKHDLYLYVDGARLASALTQKDNDVTLHDLATLCDAFYIGATKCGALFGEGLVLVRDELKKDFRFNIKQKGALLAKGRLLGVQFYELFKDGLYYEVGRHSNMMADILREGLDKHHVKYLAPSLSNQVFPILEDHVIKEIQKSFVVTVMDKIDETHHAIRLVTSFMTPERACLDFNEKLDELMG